MFRCRRWIAPLALVPMFALRAQQGITAAQADTLFQKSDWPAVAKAYTAISQREPTNALAWFRLGAARHALAEYDAAIPAYEKARELNFQVVSVEFRLARIHALKKDADRAVQALQRAVTAGFNNSIQVTTQADFANIREDAKFKALLADMDRRRFPCRTGEAQQQLNYWIGEWNVFAWNPNGPNGAAQLGVNIIEPILDHCVLLENWSSGVGGKGKSFNFYDTNVGKWRQIWMGDGGGSLDYTGEFRDGAMRFEGWTLGPNGRKTLQ